MIRIDAHQHFWTLSRGDYDFPTPDLFAIYRDFGPADLAPLNNRRDVSRTVAVQATPTVAETRFLLDIAAQEEMVGAVVGWADMTAPDVADTLASLAENPWLRGIRPMIQGQPEVDWMLRDDLDPAYTALIDLGLRFDALVHPIHLPNLHRLLIRYPELPVVIDHGAKPRIRDGAFAGWAADIARIAGDTHAYCKVSGLVTEANPDWTVATLKPYVDHLVASFGPDRLMWGSDWPVVNLAGGHEAWSDATDELLADHPDAARAAINGATARDFYAIS